MVALVSATPKTVPLATFHVQVRYYYTYGLALSVVGDLVTRGIAVEKCCRLL